MSLLEALRVRKNKLKSTDTLVKTADGNVFLERRDETGGVTLEKIASSEGYVVDLKPDLQVGRVLPGLFIGSQDVTQDESLLRQHEITEILSVGVEVCPVAGMKYTNVEALDLPEFDMRPVLDQTSRVIDEVRTSGGAVFVHCNAGVSRSSAVVIAYLMRHEKLRYQQAFDLVRQARSCIKPNEGFVKHLKNLDKELFFTESIK